MDNFKDLPLFLEALQEAGVPVGIREVDWLRRIFHTKPDLDRQGLRQVLLCTLIKNPQQRQRFEDLFELSFPPELPEAPEETTPPALAPLEDTQEVREEPVAPQATTPAVHSEEAGDPFRHPPPPPAPARWAWVGGTLSLAVILGSLFWVWQPHKTTSFQLADQLYNLLGTALWCAAFGIWCSYHRRHAPPTPAALAPGPLWQPLSPALPGGMELLTPRHLRQMVWSVERFVAEDHTRHLDMPRTVNATARAGGQAVLHYQHVIQPREVWLWVDQAMADLTMERLVWEVRTSLERAGLPCRYGRFRDFPDPITWEEGESFTPLSLEGHRQGALVLVISHGEDLARMQSLAPQRHTLSVLLHALAEWPHLAFVDSSHGRYGMAALVQRYGLRCLAPEAVATFLGAKSRESQTRPPFAGDGQAWAAGLALCPQPPEVNRALALHRAMGLRVEPWVLPTLLDTPGEDGPERPAPADCLNWLVRAEGIIGEVPPQSRLGRALTFWRQHYPALSEETRQPQAAYRRAIERALLDLWDAPQQAARDLYRMYTSKDSNGQEVFQEEITQRLGGYVARDTEVAPRHKGAIRLPWAWEDLAPQTRALLQRMGFARRWLSAPPLHTSGALGLTLGVFVGVAAALLLQGGVLGWFLLVVLSIGTGIVVPLLHRRRLQEEVAEPVEMVKIAGGTFGMGSEPDDEQAYTDERPQHQVTVSDFFMAACPVTRQQYQAVMGQSPLAWRESIVERLHQLWQVISLQRSLRSFWNTFQPQFPANYVSWFNAVQFCNTLSEQQGLQPCYEINAEQVTWDEEADGYRLPTEAEWEYAARAGTTTRWFCGDEATELGKYAWYAEGRGGPHPVGQKAPNPWGLYDMAGNVWEWCWDWYAEYTPDPADNPVGPSAGGSRVVRGGAFWDEARYLRSAFRYWYEPEVRGGGTGVRVVRRPGRQPLSP